MYYVIQGEPKIPKYLVLRFEKQKKKSGKKRKTDCYIRSGTFSFNLVQYMYLIRVKLSIKY